MIVIDNVFVGQRELIVFVTVSEYHQHDLNFHVFRSTTITNTFLSGHEHDLFSPTQRLPWPVHSVK